MKWAFYNVLFALVYPFLLPGFLVRMLRRGGYAARMGDRFALYPSEVMARFSLKKVKGAIEAEGRNSRSEANGLRQGEKAEKVKVRGEGEQWNLQHPLLTLTYSLDLQTSKPPNFQTSKPPLSSPFIWIHAVSVGEVQVAGQLMRAWREVEPDMRFCFSTTSSTGWRMAEREITERDVLIYNPLDFPNFVKSALKTVRPRAIVLTESEIWPNFIMTAKRYGIPLFLINARVSDRSAPRYRLARFFFKDVLSAFTRIFAQSELDKRRLVAAGAPEENVDVTGSFKFDVAKRNEAKERELREWIEGRVGLVTAGGRSWSEELELESGMVRLYGRDALVASDGRGEGQERMGKILLGGSTWPGEDEVLLRIYKELLSSVRPSPCLLVIAPRHFEKADAVEENIRKHGFTCIRRSKSEEVRREGLEVWKFGGLGDEVEGESEEVRSKSEEVREGRPCDGRISTDAINASLPPVFLCDTTGEMMGLFGICDVAFVGKTLCAHGSQNMIEPCLCGKPTVVGPFTENFRPVMSDLLDANAIVQVKDEAQLKSTILRWFSEGDGGLGARAASAVAKRRGVVPKCVAAIRSALQSVESVKSVVTTTTSVATSATLPLPTTHYPLSTILYPLLVLLAVAGGAWWWFAGRDRVVAKDDRVVICHEVITAAQCICDCLGGVTNGLNVLKIDARKLDCNRFFKTLAEVPDTAILWMPGEFDWLVTWPENGRKISFADVMDRYAALENSDALAKAGCDSVPAVFASYAGVVLDVRPAFAQLAPDERTVPELFVTKDLPVFDGFDFSGIDADVLKKLRDEIRSRQNVRRIILEGCIRSRKGESEAAVEAWARAAKRYANDTMLIERLEHLKTNGEVFYKLGKPAMAARCYDVMAQIRPNDPVPVFNYGVCAQRLGHADIAEKAFERARKLDAGRTGSATGKR